jgi:uncharacterized RDD family membrane protein YckC
MTSTEYPAPLASIQHRLGGRAVDVALSIVTLNIGWLIWSLVLWGQGQTPGKQLLKLRVYDKTTGKPVKWGHMAIREFLVYLTIGITSMVLDLASLWVFDFVTYGALGTLFLVAWYVAEIVFYFTKGQRTLRDILVKTLVVNEA